MNRVLIIDDDLELCELVTEFLGSEGFICETVQDGESGLAKVANESYALVVLDVMLPGLNGFEALRRIRRSGRSAPLPVLMLTARGEDVDRIVGLELGADDYLPKPFNPRELVPASAPSCAALKLKRSKRPHRRLKNFPSAMSNWTEELTAYIAAESRSS